MNILYISTVQHDGINPKKYPRIKNYQTNLY